jgi:hypothetical protein
MSVTTGRNIVRRFTGLLPLLLVAMLFAAPLIIWLVKNDQPAIVTERLKARIVSVGPATDTERRVVVTLEEGLTVIIRTRTAPPDVKPGDDVEVIRSTSPTGEVDYDLDE